MPVIVAEMGTTVSAILQFVDDALLIAKSVVCIKSNWEFFERFARKYRKYDINHKNIRQAIQKKISLTETKWLWAVNISRLMF